MTNQTAWNRAIWQIRFAVVWKKVKVFAIELWDVFAAIFTLVSVIVVAILIWAIPVFKALEFFGIIER